jgi:hypothetical protein
MFELFRSPNIVGFITASPVSLLFLPSSNQRVSCRQACAVSLRNAASRRVIWDGLTLPFTLKLPQAALRFRLHLHDGMPDCCSRRGGRR